MDRRHFTKICSSMILTASATPTELLAGSVGKDFQPSVLQSSGNTALQADELIIGEPYLFFYPYVTTPCLLINLGTEIANSKAGAGDWAGGVGPGKSIVAYSAICSHKMSHPAREISFINYRHDPINFYSHDEGKTIEKSGLISCCSERSVYDPADGARVLGGPAPQPLAAITLKHDAANGQLIATGSHGADMYDRFFDKFGFRASLEHKVGDPKTLAGKTAVVQKLSDYSKQTIKC